MKTKNIITQTDGYKFLNNSNLQNVSNVYSYFESRSGAKYPTTVFCGLQYFLKEYLEGVVVTQEKIDWAKIVAKNYLGSEHDFNEKMWKTIVDEYSGKLPITIKAVPEGAEIPESNVIMTIQLSVDDERLSGLPNHLETLLTNVWACCTTATKSKYIKRIIKSYWGNTAETFDGVLFTYHDFGMRSSKSPEAAAICGFGHLTNFLGTDTVSAWELAHDYYNEDPADISYSVWASEHNYMMYKGRDGESEVLKEIFYNRPTGIVSIVSDTFNIYNFVENLIGKEFHDIVMNRKGRTVIRPDSVTPQHDTQAKITLWILESLWKNFGGIVNNRGYKVLDTHVRVLYGDSISEDSIKDILETAKVNGFSAENLVFGCGSYLLDQHNRDTQRFTYKSSAMRINGTWRGIFKSPLGSNKKSKKGRMKLVMTKEGYQTFTEFDCGYLEAKDELLEVFRNGEITKQYTLTEIRERAKI